MRPLRPLWRFLLVAVVLAAGGVLALVDPALGQQPQTPTELWEQYPLAPDQEGSQTGSDARQPRASRNDEQPAVRRDTDAAATEDESFPLLVTIAASLLFLGLAVGAFTHGRWVKERMRERFRLLRGMAPRYRPRPVVASPGAELLAQEWRPRPPAAPRRDVEQRAEADDKWGKQPNPPPATPAPKKLVPHKPRQAKRHKPPPAKPPQSAQSRQPAKPARATKPTAAAKPAKAAKPAGVAKPVSPRRPKRARPAKPEPPAPLRPPTERPLPDQKRSLGIVRPTKLTCSIFGWRSGEVADFYALASGLRGRDWIVERSPRFRWAAGETPAEAYEAHATLVEALTRAGWRLVGIEGAWYRQCFERSVEGPSSDD